MKYNVLSIVSLGLLLTACCGGPKPSYTVPAPEDVMMYQVNPRVFAAESSFNAVAQQLDSIRALGANVVWFMPVYEVGRERSVNSPYCIRDYKALNPEFGTMEEFSNLVAQCHAKGMSVILDWVANHTSWDNAWVADHPEWYTRNAEGEIISPEGTGWLDVADLDFDNREMRLAMIDAMKFWVNEAGIDGFRCDAADFVPRDFWKQAIDSLRAIPGRKLLMLAEGKRKDHFLAGFEMNYAWDFMTALRDVFIRDSSARLLYRTDSMEYDSIPAGCVKLRFTTNHDEATKLSPVVEYGGERGSMSAFAIAAFLRGGALIYGSQEVGYPEPINFFHYVPVDWTSNPALRAEYAHLMHLYNTLPALRKGEMIPCPNEDCMLFEKRLDGESVLIAANVRDREITAGLPAEWQGRTVTDLMSGERLTLEPTLTLDAYAYRIFQ